MTRPSKKDKGFTLIELAVVVVVISALFSVFNFSGGTFTYWSRETFLRRLTETIHFLHQRAITDNVYYRIEFHLDEEKPYYRVGQVVPEEIDYDNSSASAISGANVDPLSAEIALRSNPRIGTSQYMIEPQSFPSLAKPTFLPEKTFFTDVVTRRGTFTSVNENEEAPGIVFSPLGFTEFGVIHLRMENKDNENADITILVNPFTGLTSVYREYKEFEYTYGRNEQP